MWVIRKCSAKKPHKLKWQDCFFSEDCLVRCFLGITLVLLLSYSSFRQNLVFFHFSWSKTKKLIRVKLKIYQRLSWWWMAGKVPVFRHSKWLYTEEHLPSPGSMVLVLVLRAVYNNAKSIWSSFCACRCSFFFLHAFWRIECYLRLLVSHE